MDENWWPALLADFAAEEPWGRPDVVVAEIGSDDDGERMVTAALVPIGDLPDLAGRLVDIGYKVETNGPRPEPGAEPFKPTFWVFGGREAARLEPLVLSWQTNNHVTLAIDPGFLMTYGLASRTVGQGTLAYDDPYGPVYDVATATGPARYDFPTWEPASVTIQRDYLQDYLTLRGVALVQGFYVRRRGPLDLESAALLGDRDAVEFKLAGREVQLNRRRDDSQNQLLVQVWGGRVVAKAGDLPVTADLVAQDGLVWPGIERPVTQESFSELRDTMVFVRDDVLGAYEDHPEFSVYPERGGVAFGTQWSVGFCDRVGRDLIQLELRKLYEGAPHTVIRHWHSHVVPAPARTPNERQPNIATRAHGVVDGLLMLGEGLEALARRMNLEGASSTDFIGLDQAALEHNGWWTADTIAPITRHVPLGMTVGAFLARCVDLDNLTSEGLSRRTLRSLCRTLGFEDRVTKDLGALKLLDLAVLFGAAAVQNSAALPDEGPDVAAAVVAQDPPVRHLNRLFALNDLRNLGAHAGRDVAKLWTALRRYDFEPNQAAGGYGVILDGIYDAIALELGALVEIVQAAAKP